MWMPENRSRIKRENQLIETWEDGWAICVEFSTTCSESNFTCPRENSKIFNYLDTMSNLCNFSNRTKEQRLVPMPLFAYTNHWLYIFSSSWGSFRPVGNMGVGLDSWLSQTVMTDPSKLLDQKSQLSEMSLKFVTSENLNAPSRFPFKIAHEFLKIQILLRTI